MEKSDDQTHYDVLNIPFTADSEQIRAAYYEQLSIYDTDSLITYSLLSKSERQTILDRFQEAYKVLMNADRRKEYDKCLKDAGHVNSANGEKRDRHQSKPVFSMYDGETIRQTEKNIRQKQVEMDIRSLKDDLHARTALSGADLKSVRTALHLELDEIFAVTRIPVSVLKAMEADVIQKLPSAVYLKRHIKQYADCLGLDPSVILPAYLNYLKTVS